LLTFTFIYVTLLWHRIRLARMTEHVEQRRMQLTSA